MTHVNRRGFLALASGLLMPVPEIEPVPRVVYSFASPPVEQWVWVELTSAFSAARKSVVAFATSRGFSPGDIVASNARGLLEHYSTPTYSNLLPIGRVIGATRRHGRLGEHVPPIGLDVPARETDEIAHR